MEQITQQIKLLAQSIAMLTTRVEEIQVTKETHSMNQGGNVKGEHQTLKVKIPDSDGSFDPKVFIEWERSLIHYFDFKDTPENKKFKITKLKLTKQAAMWFKELQYEREHHRKEKISTWEHSLRKMCKSALTYSQFHSLPSSFSAKGYKSP